MQTANGERQGAIDTEPPPPGWMTVAPEAVVAQLTNQLAGMIQQLAMRDAYIAQLHEALALSARAVPQENQPGPG